MQDVDLTYIAKITKGFSGADLTEICQRVGQLCALLQLRERKWWMEVLTVAPLARVYFNNSTDSHFGYSVTICLHRSRDPIRY